MSKKCMTKCNKSYTDMWQKNVCNHLIILALLSFLFKGLNAQTDTLSIENIRGLTGIDPIIVHSKIQYNLYVLDIKGPSAKITYTPGVSFGVKRWSTSVKASVVSLISGIPGEGFKSGIGDIKLSVQTRIYSKNKHSIAVSGELAIPTGKNGYGCQYFSLTPILTYTYAIVPSLIFALQPQYSFHLLKDPISPDLSTITVRSLIAKFTKKGSAYGLEVKPACNLTTNTFTAFLSPFLSNSLGGGFNMLLMCDLPLNHSAVETGPTYQLGINRNF
jgi:hypothetical protein